ncbi:MAG TPA: hypothetical protein VJ385_08640 [Fibrobacteria bacterium]|nr:hypothetical protein [Fibrobacteria bacterium]
MNVPTKTTPSLRRPLLALFAMATAIPGLGAGIGFRMYQADNAAAGAGKGTTSVQSYVDWSHTTTAAGHSNYGTWTNPNGSSTKYTDYQVFGSPAPATAKCFDMSTEQVNADLVADPIIWVKTSDGLWKKLADDVFGAFAFAKIWVEPGSFFNSFSKIRLAAYSSNHNSEAFKFRSNWSSSDLASCMGGTNPGAIVRASGEVVLVRSK